MPVRAMYHWDCETKPTVSNDRYRYTFHNSIVSDDRYRQTFHHSIVSDDRYRYVDLWTLYELSQFWRAKVLKDNPSHNQL